MWSLFGKKFHHCVAAKKTKQNDIGKKREKHEQKNKNCLTTCSGVWNETAGRCILPPSTSCATPLRQIESYEYIRIIRIV